MSLRRDAGSDTFGEGGPYIEGAQMGVLEWDFEAGSGSVRLQRNFMSELDGLAKLDVLNDWITQLESAYKEAYDEARDDMNEVEQDTYRPGS